MRRDVRTPTPPAASLSRRAFLVTSASLPLAAGRTRSAQRRQPGPAVRLETDADIDRAIPSLTNWGRWGADDQLGTLNLLTPARRRRAAALAREGRVVPLAREVSVTKTEGIRRGTYEMQRDEGGARDFVGMIFHGFAQTHLDALCHGFTPDGRTYNGYSATETVTPDGALRLGVEVIAARGVVGRGVLLDVAAVRGAALEPGTAIRVAELEAAERAHRVRVGEGDILLVRTGAGVGNTRERRSGLHPECLPWLKARGVALLGGDGDNDAHPLPLERWASPIHSVAIPYLGLPLVDNAELDALGAACRELLRWEFLLTLAPWRFRGTTSSPVNPLAVL
jgi:kynurenine formamidase